MDQKSGAQPDIFSITFTDQMKASLGAASRWARILAIVGFVSIGLWAAAFTLITLSQGSSGSGSSAYNAGYWFGYFLGVLAFLGAILFYPAFALLKYANKARGALAAADETQMEAAFGYLKTAFRYIVILSVASGSFLVVGVISLIIRALS